MNIVHKSGQHESCPLIIKAWFSAPTLTQEFSFTESCKYNHGDNDQYDWNKLTGISFNLIRSRVNTVMCAWRYNIEEDCFDLCAYYHINGSFNPPNVRLCSVKVNEKFKVTFEFNKAAQKVSLIIVAGEKYVDTSDFNSFGICRQINTWFGGTKPAPHDMLIIKY